MIDLYKRIWLINSDKQEGQKYLRRDSLDGENHLLQKIWEAKWSNLAMTHVTNLGSSIVEVRCCVALQAFPKFSV